MFKYEGCACKKICRLLLSKRCGEVGKWYLGLKNHSKRICVSLFNFWPVAEKVMVTIYLHYQGALLLDFKERGVNINVERFAVTL